MPFEPSPSAVRYGSRDGSTPEEAGCSVCGAARPSARAQYCSEACKQRAYRHRQRAATLPRSDARRAAVGRARTLAQSTVYGCPVCAERYLGERRCPTCNLFCRALGLGGPCPDCEALLLLTELVPALDQA